MSLSEDESLPPRDALATGQESIESDSSNASPLASENGDMEGDGWAEEFPSGDFPSDERRQRFLHCFHCNRQEAFFSALRPRWFYPYVLGFTFGLINLIGPFRCKCCGHRRLFFRDWMHPRRWFSK